jgi:repressor LexA
MCHLRALERKGLITRKANKSRAIELTGDNARSTTGLPLMGIVSEHLAHLDTNPTDVIDLGKTLATGDRFVVQVSGAGYLKHGILDGDYLIAEQDHASEEGDLVVVKSADGRVSLQTWDARSQSPIDIHGKANDGAEVLGVAVSMVRESLR